jgi:uncharacterized protein DUF1648
VVHTRLCGRANTGGHALMPPTGPDDREERARRGTRPQGSDPAAAREGDPTETARYPDEEAAPTAAEEVGEIADPDAAPPVHRDPSAPDPSRVGGSLPPQSWGGATYPPGYGQGFPPESPERASPGKTPPQPARRYDRFGWPIHEGGESDERGQQPTPPVPGGDAWRGYPPRGPYSGQFPVQQPAPNQPPRQSGAFPAAPPEQASRSGAFPIPTPPPSNVARSGQFPVAPPDPGYQSGAYSVPPESGTGEYAVRASGPIPQSPYISGQLPRVNVPPDAMQRSGQFAYPSELTSTGSRRVIVAPDAGVGSLLADRPALVFLVAALVLAGVMIAYIALRYAHFPDQIALHFGPAGSSQPNRIGEKRELWTIPFIVGIVLAANTALAWAVYRYDRFAARLLTVGCALVAAIAWVVLLTLLHR